MNNKNGAWEKSELSKPGQGCRALQIKVQHASVQAAKIAPLMLLGKQRETCVGGHAEPRAARQGSLGTGVSKLFGQVQTVECKHKVTLN